MYRTIDCEIEDDPKFRDLPSDTAQHLFIRLIIHRFGHVSGVYVLEKALLAAKMHLDLDTFEQNFQILLDAKLIEWDEDRRIVFVRSMWKRQQHRGFTHEKIAKHLKTLYETPLLYPFFKKYPEILPAFLSEIHKAPVCSSLLQFETTLNSFALQDQDQDQDQDIAASPSGDDCPTHPKNDEKPTKPKTKKETDPKFQRCMDWYCSQHMEIKHEKLTIIGKRDMPILKSIINTCQTEEEFQRRALLFLNDPLEWQKNKKSWALSVLQKCINQYADYNKAQREEIQAKKKAQEDEKAQILQSVRSNIEQLSDEERMDLFNKAYTKAEKSLKMFNSSIIDDQVKKDTIQQCEIEIYCHEHNVQIPP